MTAETIAPLPGAEPARVVRGLVVLGDSTPVGIGDPLPGGGWRGFGPLLLGSLGAPGAVRYANVSFPGARMADVRRRQLGAAVRVRPDVAVLVVGMNDTLRSDFDPVALTEDYDAVVAALRAAGATVLTVRFHDHSRVFWLPGPLRRALRVRINELNAVTDAVVARHRIGRLDLDTLPGGYHRAAWSVDRLHPSELGHRMLARGFGELLSDAGFAVPHPVSLARGGGREITAAHHLLWLVLKGLPWVWRRGRDLVPYAASIALRELAGAPALSARQSH
ncbi:SGNH/GDSL hydrolase family protein [Pseudonocardia acaciae]|uniref:SGNH/GDSL hydrolase family protein n=1 Tax=Pseudonocardia acaciae TaxID=551276 RepID=UPI0007E8BC9C|nr:SGNH/GDSL hydrolase family protein [Pseudonocardia acaciae]